MVMIPDIMNIHRPLGISPLPLVSPAKLLSDVFIPLKYKIYKKTRSPVSSGVEFVVNPAKLVRWKVGIEPTAFGQVLSYNHHTNVHEINPKQNAAFM
mmetsp:Transcript_4690/g.4833  ORF Transcript_4690/g.4833 Transcript_4690/m.4833 type:complete len:97 (+) Transcript_4690:1357-1647(+)